jgi:hypothetical protein
MTRRCWIRSLTIVMSVALVCYSAGSKEPAMLSVESFAKARAFIESTGRPLERARFKVHFEHGSSQAVIAELAKFQNADGGFASYLESDNRWSGSSPMATMIGLRILNEVNAPVGDVHVQAAVKYLLASFDDRKGYWHAIPKEANAAPHAPWWHVHDEIGKCEIRGSLTRSHWI